MGGHFSKWSWINRDYREIWRILSTLRCLFPCLLTIADYDLRPHKYDCRNPHRIFWLLDTFAVTNYFTIRYPVNFKLQTSKKSACKFDQYRCFVMTVVQNRISFDGQINYWGFLWFFDWNESRMNGWKLSTIITSVPQSGDISQIRNSFIC
jgi:hypothetical protein